MEKFKILDSIPLYEVSNYGNVRRLGTSNNLKPSTAKKNGYLGLSLYCQGKQYKKYVHRLVAEVFLGDIKDMSINHKDGNKLNNDASNLEIVTASENNKHAYKIGLRTFTNKQRNALLQSRQKAVIDIQTGICYDSLAEACRVTNDNYSTIRKRIMRKSSNVRFIYV